MKSNNWTLVSLLLITITLCITGPGNIWGREVRDNTKDRKYLPKELEGIKINDSFIESSHKKVGLIHALEGKVVVFHRSDKTAYSGRQGDTLYENDSITTLADSRCRIKLLTEDVVTIAPETSLSIDSFIDDKALGRKKSLFSMARGKAMFYVMRLFRYRESRFDLKTPTAVVGVRGTKFGVNVYEEEERHAGLGIRVADISGNMGEYLAQAAQGGNIVTVVASGDGQVMANGKLITPGNVYNSRDNTVTFNPNVLSNIEAESKVEVKTEETSGVGDEVSDEKTQDEDSGEEEGSDEDTDQAIAPEEGENTTAYVESSNISSTTSEKVSEITQQETASPPDIADGKTGSRVSAIALMIADSTNGVLYAQTSPKKEPIYTPWGPNELSGGAETYVAYESGHAESEDQDYMIKVQETSDTTMDMEVTYLDWGYGTNLASGISQDFEWNLGGHYLDEDGREYLEWGWWEDTDGGKIGTDGTDDYYAASAKIWEVEGDTTHPDYLSYLQQQNVSATYNGEVKGVYGDSSATNVVVLTGSVSFDVDFGTSQLSDFDIDINTGGTQIHMNNGSAIINNDGNFDIDNFDATVNGAATTHAYVGGMFCGAKAQGAGGTWEINKDYEWAAGEFHAMR